MTTATRPNLHDDKAYAAAEAAVTAFVAELQESLAAGDADGYDRRFAADLLWGSPYGLTLAGYDDLNRAHRWLMARNVAPPSRFEVVQILVPRHGVAVAHIRRQALVPDGFSEMALYVLVERDGEWWLAAGQNTPIA